MAESGGAAYVPSLPLPRPKSPPEYPDLYGKRREMAKIQLLEREIGFLEEELKSVGGLQPASKCCKEVADFVAAHSDPLISTSKKIHTSCRFWKWLCRSSCFSISWICCCGCSCPEMPRCKRCNLCNCCCSCINCSMPKCHFCCSWPKCNFCCSWPKCNFFCSWPKCQCLGKKCSCCNENCCHIECPSCPHCSCCCTCSCSSCNSCACCRPKCPKVNLYSCCSKNCCHPCCYLCD